MEAKVSPESFNRCLLAYSVILITATMIMKKMTSLKFFSIDIYCRKLTESSKLFKQKLKVWKIDMRHLKILKLE